MNSLEQIIPSEREVAEIIAVLHSKIDLIGICSCENFAMLEGCQEAIKILCGKKTSYNDISDDLITDNGWIIAVLAVDYLNGICDGKIFKDLPIR
ncbi:hypothetical protein [Dyadobacter sp. CY326]|uniref:hypothetical protein n=1 Tax=Dyadobacter sp. CY326 TaxID=2907300 RepID=UPI001F325241|nr:hypothetical protein [Dyadobacter sp. CY326]MCE7065232.1 hypothetical protein [Dyadobacter sp. CY326]